MPDSERKAKEQKSEQLISTEPAAKAPENPEYELELQRLELRRDERIHRARARRDTDLDRLGKEKSEATVEHKATQDELAALQRDFSSVQAELKIATETQSTAQGNLASSQAELDAARMAFEKASVEARSASVKLQRLENVFQPLAIRHATLEDDKKRADAKKSSIHELIKNESELTNETFDQEETRAKASFERDLEALKAKFGIE